MKKVLLVTAGALIVIALAAVAYVFLGTDDAGEAPAPGDPFGGLTSGERPDTATIADTISFRLSDGSVVTVPNFTKENQPEWAGSSGYLVNGDPADSYMTTYIPTDESGNPGSLTIVLQAEPLGEVRRQAEEALRTQFRLTNQQLCLMGISVYAQPGLSDVFDRRNLGLSFCQGSVKLP